MNDRFTCPRRAENGMDVAGPLRGSGPDQDTWQKNRGLLGQRRGCSYCGSMHPDDFMNAVRNGRVIGVTDKSYKFYVEDGSDRGKFYTPHLHEDQGWGFDFLWKSGRINFDFKPGALFIPGPSTTEKDPSDA